ncbi:MAG: zinc-ribbon domain-containing protein [Minwuia sp.]|nr:zinc-ribbon domain-containing protein [Minwuia sp.]
MILTCPACATRYVIGDDVFQVGTREVRCARCSHSWTTDGSDAVDEVDARMDLQTEAPKPKAESRPPAPAAEQVGFGLNDLPGMDGAEAGDGIGTLADDGLPEVDAEPADEDDDAETSAAPVLSADPRPEAGKKAKPGRARPEKAGAGSKPAARASRRRTPVWVWIGWVVLLACICGLAAALLLLRGPLVEAWPPLQRLYDTVGTGAAGQPDNAHEDAAVALALESSELVDDHGKRQLNLLIRLTNSTDLRQPLPIAVLHLLRADGETEKTERIRLPSDQPLAPKESRVMALRLSDVPAVVTSVSAEGETGSGSDH